MSAPTSELLERLLKDREDINARINSERARLRARYLHTDHNAVRAWALANGHSVGVRGRVPQTLVEAYLSAQADRQFTIDDLGATA